MKSIMISIQPQYVAQILNGEKTIEIRKTMPKCELPVKVYIYCTKPTRKENRKPHRWSVFWIKRVVAEFTLNKVDKLVCASVPYRKENNLGYERFIDNGVYQLKDEDGMVFERVDSYLDTMLKNEDFNKMQLKPKDIYDYLGGYGKFYAWHIDDLKIYDKPKSIEEFGVKKAFQSWGYVEKL